VLGLAGPPARGPQASIFLGDLEASSSSTPRWRAVLSALRIAEQELDGIEVLGTTVDLVRRLECLVNLRGPRPMAPTHLDTSRACWRVVRDRPGSGKQVFGGLATGAAKAIVDSPAARLSGLKANRLGDLPLPVASSRKPLTTISGRYVRHCHFALASKIRRACD
jgi:hypothetical protein